MAYYLKGPKRRKWRGVYSNDLKAQVIELYRSHSAREVAKIVGLSYGQVQGILDVARRNGVIPKMFKDKRDKTPWGSRELLALSRMVGLISSEEVAKRLNRSSARNIKERMRVSFNSKQKFLHGMPRSWVLEVFGDEFLDRQIETTAGPRSEVCSWRFKITLWVDLQHMGYAVGVSESFQTCLNALARFQYFLWQSHSPDEIRNKIKGVIHG